MFNIKNVKTQKKLIHLFVFVVTAAAIIYSALFLYTNFYHTINWKDQAASDFNQRTAIKHVNLDEMRQVVDQIKKDKTSTSSSEFDISIDFR